MAKGLIPAGSRAVCCMEKLPEAPSEWLRTRDLPSLLALQQHVGSAGGRYLESRLSIHGFCVEGGAKQLVHYPGPTL